MAPQPDPVEVIGAAFDAEFGPAERQFAGEMVVAALKAAGYVIERAPEPMVTMSAPPPICRWDPTNMRPYGDNQCQKPATRYFYVMGRRIDACEECAQLAGMQPAQPSPTAEGG